MPEAKPKPPAPTPLGVVHSAGKQEDHQSAGAELAAKLGWKGGPDWIANDITVADATGFLVKTLHECFIAGAKGEPQPDPDPACDHLGLTPSDTAEKVLVAAALKQAFESGKGAEVTEHAIRLGELGRADMTLKISGDDKKAGN